MAEQVQDLPQSPEDSRGGDFLFSPVGAAPFMTPERFTDEQRQFFATGAEFVTEEILPAAARLEQKDNALLKQLLAKAGELGLLGVDVPEELGGLGLDKTTSMLIAESQAGYGSWATTFGAHVGIGTLPIVFFGTAQQKAKYLPDLATGRKVAAYALSEAGSGSDALGARTVARLSPDGRHYVVNGGKMWITNGGFADVQAAVADLYLGALGGHRRFGTTPPASGQRLYSARSARTRATVPGAGDSASTTGGGDSGYEAPSPSQQPSPRNIGGGVAGVRGPPH